MAWLWWFWRRNVHQSRSSISVRHLCFRLSLIYWYLRFTRYGRLRFGGIFSDHFITCLLLSPPVKDVWKLVNIWRKFWARIQSLLSWLTGTCTRALTVFLLPSCPSQLDRPSRWVCADVVCPQMLAAMTTCIRQINKINTWPVSGNTQAFNAPGVSIDFAGTKGRDRHKIRSRWDTISTAL